MSKNIINQQNFPNTLEIRPYKIDKFVELIFTLFTIFIFYFFMLQLLIDNGIILIMNALTYSHPIIILIAFVIFLFFPLIWFPRIIRLINFISKKNILIFKKKIGIFYGKKQLAPIYDMEQLQIRGFINIYFKNEYRLSLILKNGNKQYLLQDTDYFKMFEMANLIAETMHLEVKVK